MHQEFFFLSLMHPIGPELPISAHVACARVCRQLYVLRAGRAFVQATVGVGTVIIVYICLAYTRGRGYFGTLDNTFSFYIGSSDWHHEVFFTAHKKTHLSSFGIHCSPVIKLFCEISTLMLVMGQFATSVFAMFQWDFCAFVFLW